ncbi:IS1182 family transposase [Lactobacillus panisapium]|uniref:IS1182 family transposase n=1 Tax=Lactobacillus panisapium TaxID=2012495 RepID=A0ABX8W3X0_9LACO|nr:IS1182 family transposase [Lactobacillus panisapium]QYN52416.1 IS1182 family transposase [Lactobacillus panisapium]
MYQNYTTGQTALVLNLDFTIPQNHLVHAISQFVDSIPLAVLEGESSATGRPAYHPARMLKILLFAYSRKVFSGRKIAQMLTENLPMMYLADQQTMSYHTINNFRASKHANQLIKKCFLYFNHLLQEEGLVYEHALFIDGTKVEADANKYSFVWRKAVDRFQAKLQDEALALYQELVEEEVVKAMAAEEVQSSQGLNQLANEVAAEVERLDQAIANEPKAIPGGSKQKQKRRRLKKLFHRIRRDYQPRAQKYEEYQALFKGRNSFSKTDHDATFMRMKEDPMLNGQLKPGYNLQVATSNQYVIDYALYPNSTDTRTLVPFLEQLAVLGDFDTIVADAGYGSEYNYAELTDHFGKQFLIPYTTYEKEQKRKYRHDPTKLDNWYYDETEDYYLDHQGVRFNFKHYSTRHDRYGFTRQFKVYEADEFQLNAAKTALAKTPSGRQRQLNYNPTWQYFKAQVQAALQSKTGKRIYGQRKIDVEPVFGHLKNVFGMRRVHLRGQAKVENDLGLMLMTMNLKKYWQRSGPNSQLWRAERSKKQLKHFFQCFGCFFFCLKS